MAFIFVLVLVLALTILNQLSADQPSYAGPGTCGRKKFSEDLPPLSFRFRSATRLDLFRKFRRMARKNSK